MRLRFLASLATGLLLTGWMFTAGALAQEAGLSLKMGSAFPGKLPQLGTLGVGLADKVARISGGRLRLEFHEPNALLPPQEMFDAIAAGSLDAAWSTPGYWFDKEPALALFSGVPFGPAAGEFAAWIYSGGGEKMMQEIYARHGIRSMICGITVPEAAGWFRKEIRTAADLRGLKMRIRGLGAVVMERLGVQPQVIEGADIYEALKQGTIDAAEYSTPAIDLGLGFHRVAKYYYFPGWHQQSTLFELMLSEARWRGLDDAQKAQLEIACGDNFRDGLAQGEAIQSKALNELEAKGVKTQRWPLPVLQALRKEWEAVAAQLSEQDETFRNTYDSLQTFRRDYRLWKNLGYLR